MLTVEILISEVPFCNTNSLFVLHFLLLPALLRMTDLLIEPFQRQMPMVIDGKYLSFTFYHNNFPAKGVPDALPRREELFLLLDSSGEAPAPFHRLIVWAGVRYVLLLEYNETKNSCEENAALEKLHNAADVDAICAAREGCMQLFWPFLEKAYQARHKTARGSSEAGASDLGRSSTVNFKLVTINGSLVAVEHSKSLDIYGKPMENPYPDLPTFRQSQIEEEQKIHDFLSKVKIDGVEHCFKRHRHLNEWAFLQEVKALRAGNNNRNVMKLHGFVGSSDGFVIDAIYVGFFS